MRQFDIDISCQSDESLSGLIQVTDLLGSILCFWYFIAIFLIPILDTPVVLCWHFEFLVKRLYLNCNLDVPLKNHPHYEQYSLFITHWYWISTGYQPIQKVPVSISDLSVICSLKFNLLDEIPYMTGRHASVFACSVLLFTVRIDNDRSNNGR